MWHTVLECTFWALVGGMSLAGVWAISESIRYGVALDSYIKTNREYARVLRNARLELTINRGLYEAKQRNSKHN
jgi:hypothetical protein